MESWRTVTDQDNSADKGGDWRHISDDVVAVVDGSCGDGYADGCASGQAAKRSRTGTLSSDWRTVLEQDECPTDNGGPSDTTATWARGSYRDS